MTIPFMVASARYRESDIGVKRPEFRSTFLYPKFCAIGQGGATLLAAAFIMPKV